jgi:hypothetical protein
MGWGMSVAGSSIALRFSSLGLRAPAALAVGILFSGLVAFASTSPAAAQPMNAEEACTPDVMRLCGEYIPDRGRIVACLKRKRLALSPGCRQVMSPSKSKPRKRARKRG